MSASPRLRCAIYTRKSSEEGLEQDFNSLHAQREACEAFILSQVGLGWKLIHDHYDDGGISGGTLARPALQRLLDDVKSGRIDVVVVYKIDRLTRSLADFAKIVEVFDERSVSFVSVTQSFNTTSSMGRLTLNVLLSFAQFEREVTGERIRDKIAASKKKGMWMGGLVPLGYDAQARKLIINDAEASTVRQLFALYLELGSLRMLQLRAQQLGLRTKQHTSRSGSTRGGLGFSCGHLRTILTNPLYVGMIRHGKHSYEGQHEAILDRQTFNQVQTLLASKANTSTSAAGKDKLHVLTGLIFDETGDRLSPTHATKNGRRYRYYVSRRLTKGAKADGPEPWRLPAMEIEKLVENRLIQFLRSDTQLLDMFPQSSFGAGDISRLLSEGRSAADTLGSSSFENRKKIISALVYEIVVNPDSIAIRLNAAGLLEIPGEKSITLHPDTDLASVVRTITVPIALRHRGVETKLVLNNKPAALSTPEPGLLTMLKQAHQFLQALSDGTGLTIAELATRERIDVSDLSRIIRFAFLAPNLAEAIVEGRQPVELTRHQLSRLTALPQLWSDQRALLRF
jgi:DNA invertase Pin-like site-specific DNA recombinase